MKHNEAHFHIIHMIHMKNMIYNETYETLNI